MWFELLTHPTRLDHPWPLVGAHANGHCSWCHKKNARSAFIGTAKECVACHRIDYDRSTFEGHDTFPLTCEKCHSQIAWRRRHPRPSQSPT